MKTITCTQCGDEITRRSDLIIAKTHYLSLPKAYHRECFSEEMLTDMNAFYTQLEPINSVLYSLRIGLLAVVYVFLFLARESSGLYLTFLVAAGFLLGVELFTRLYSLFAFEIRIHDDNHHQIFN